MFLKWKMSKRILVTSNCQTAGIAATLRCTMQNVVVDAMPAHQLPKDDQEARGAVSNYDAWVTSERADIFNNEPFSPQVVVCPRLMFSAFHPDIAYVANAATGEAVANHNSRIIAWAWSKQLSIEETKSLFNRNVFAALGYLDRWDEEVANLRNYFESSSSLSFIDFFLSLKREALFMHDVEHPTAAALVKLGKLVARELGASKISLSADISIADSFEHLSWPVYPEIAHQLGLKGSYVWGELRAYGGGLRGYIEHSFARFRNDNHDPGQVTILTNNGYVPIDELLGPILAPFQLF